MAHEDYRIVFRSVDEVIKTEPDIRQLLEDSAKLRDDLEGVSELADLVNTLNSDQPTRFYTGT